MELWLTIYELVLADKERVYPEGARPEQGALQYSSIQIRVFHFLHALPISEFSLSKQYITLHY